MSKRSVKAGHGSLSTGAITGLALVVQTGLAAFVGVLIARKFGRTEETDGFFAAYGVFIVLALAANTVRLVVLPAFERARAQGQLGRETLGWVLALGVLTLPLAGAAVIWPDPAAMLLTESDVARESAATVLPWLVVAGAANIFAGLGASALAALDDYVTPAVGYVAGSVLGLVVILGRIEENGLQAVAGGMTLVGLTVMVVAFGALAARARTRSAPIRGLVPGTIGFSSRLAVAFRGCLLPFASQGAYLICLAYAAREGIGAQTSLGYAYLAASAVVSATAASFGLVTSVPLTRVGLSPARVATHVGATTWLALLGVALTAGIAATAGEPIVAAVLGSGFEQSVGSELGELIAVMAPWMVVTAAVTVAFPLIFVAGSERVLLPTALAVVLVQALSGLVLREAFGLHGIALSLAVSTGVGLLGLTIALRATRPTIEALATATAVVAALAALSFIPAAFLPTVVGGVVGAVLFVGMVAFVRPVGLRSAIRYLRALGPSD